MKNQQHVKALRALRVQVLELGQATWVDVTVEAALAMARRLPCDRAVFLLNRASVFLDVLSVDIVDLRLHLALAHARNAQVGLPWPECETGASTQESPYDLDFWHVPGHLAYGLDHVVVNVTDLAAAKAFYRDRLGLPVRELANGQTVIDLGNSMIKLHVTEEAAYPRAALPVPGSADLCITLAGAFMDDIVDVLARRGVQIACGPVLRHGALGQLESVYVVDPSGNLIELAVGARWRTPTKLVSHASPHGVDLA